jgi:erythromycin esterase
MRRAFLALVLCLSVVPSAAATPRSYLNLDFEAPECTAEWTELTGRQGPFDYRVDTSGGHSGQQSMQTRYVRQSPWTPATGGGGMHRRFPMNEVAGQRLKVSASIRSEGITAGYAGLWVTIFNQDGSAAVVNMAFRGVTGTSPWARHEVEIDVPVNAIRGFVGFELRGNGTAWFDDFVLELDGHVWHDGPPPHLPVPTPGHINWVQQNAIPVTTVEAGHSTADLQRLKNIIGDARIVSLGEATHGTREFFQMKHRLLEFLVTEMGFTHFSLEANMPEAQKLNEYVLTGQGDPEELLEGMYFWTWNTQEVLEMIHWMRAYNASGRGPVQFTGFDAQISWGAADNLRSFLAAADPAYLPTAESAFARVDAAEIIWRATPQDVAAAVAVYDHMVARRNDYLASHSAEMVDWMIQNARVIVQVIGGIAGTTPRDQSMAENVEWILDHAPAGSKIVLWAHNRHVNRVPGWMGTYLDQRYGDDMYVLGFALGEGRYNAIGRQGLTSHQVHTPVQGSIESLLQATGMPRYILDLRHTAAEAPDVWFLQERLLQSPGSVHFRCAFLPSVVAQEYDGLIWIDPTTPSVLLPFD